MYEVSRYSTSRKTMRKKEKRLSRKLRMLMLPRIQERYFSLKLLSIYQNTFFLY